MTLNNAIHFFEKLVSETPNKSEIKVYEKFLHILNRLKSRTFSEQEMLSIEAELEFLYLESKPKNRKKHMKKALHEFETYLKDTYSLISKGYYSSLGMALGSTFGLLFGLVVLSHFERNLGVLLGSIFGMVLGMVVGRNLDAKAVAEGRAL